MLKELLKLKEVPFLAFEGQYRERENTDNDTSKRPHEHHQSPSGQKPITIHCCVISPIIV